MVSKNRKDQRLREKNSQVRLVKVVLVVALFVLSLGIFANAMVKPLSRDEHMYCTAGALLAQGKTIYRDFSYMSQMPYHPLLLATIYRLLHTQHYLLIGRLVSSTCDIVTMICIVLIYWRAFGGFRLHGAFFGFCAVLLYVYHPLVQYANGYAWNHDVVVACVAVSFLLFAVGRPEKKSGRYLRAAVIGALLTFASCMRITTVIVEILFLPMILLEGEATLDERLKAALCFLGAAAVVSLWPLYLLIQAPRAFIVNLFHMSVLNGQWLHEIGLFHDKKQLALANLMLPVSLMLIILTVYLWCVVIYAWRKQHRMDQMLVVSLSLLLPAGFYLISFIPPAMWRQYLAVPVPFWVITFAFPLALITKSMAMGGMRLAHRAAVVIVVLSTLVGVFSSPPVLRRIAVLARYDDWTATRLHKVSRHISEKTCDPRLVLTTAPLYALEGGCKIYPELSAGVIIYRIADEMSREDRLATVSVGPKGLGRMLEERPPAAVLLGVEQGPMTYLEEPIKEAVGPNWQTVSYENGLTLHYKP